MVSKPHGRFLLASTTLSSSEAGPPCDPNPLCFTLHEQRNSSRRCTPHFFAFINAPIQLIDSGSGDGTGTSTPPPLTGRREQSDTPAAAQQPEQERRPRFPPWNPQLALPSPKSAGNRHIMAEQGHAFDAASVAVESCAGRRRRVYVHRGGTDTPPGKQQQQQPSKHDSSQHQAQGFDIVDERQTHEDHFRALVHAYLLPNGFPDSVAPQYAPYMGWRGVQYFFGGAISVFTTQSLLGALGVAGRYSGEAAAAINWVIKDGAGRLGRLLFARWGRELDCELKQFRLAGRCGPAGWGPMCAKGAGGPRAAVGYGRAGQHAVTGTGSVGSRSRGAP